MTTLQFADTHNLVAFLAKPAESEGFEQIVDFLNAHTIKYALTVNPTIYTSCIEQFWATVKAKTVNGEVQLQALVDGKKIITTAWNEFSSTMASIIICLATNQKFNFSKYIFESMVKNLDNAGKFLMYLRVGKGFSERETPLFPTMVVQKQAEMSEDKAIYEERGDSLERVATTAAGLDAEQDRGNINKTQSKETPNELSSQGTSLGSGPRRQETMGDTIAQTRSENVSKFSNDPLLARVIDLEKTKTAQAQEITSLKLRVKKLDKKGGSRTHKLKRLYKVDRSARIVSSDKASLGDQEDVSKHGRKINDIDKNAKITLVDETQGRYGNDIMFDVSDLAGEEVFVAEQGVPESKKDDVAQVNTVATTISTASTIPVSVASITDVEITLAQALAELKSAKPTTATSTRPKAKGLAKIQDKGKAKMIEPEPLKKLLKKDQLKLDEEVAQRLQAEFDEQERIKREKAEVNIALKETWDDIQAKIKDDQLLAEILQAREQEELTIKERVILFQQLLEKRRKHFAAKRAEEKRNRPPTKAQQRSIMCTYLKNIEGWKPKDLKRKSFANIQELFGKAMKRVNTFVDYRTELVEGSSKNLDLVYTSW
ncbi:hypothetical protein Tco_0559045 [Tanacetum coccineum]